MGGKAVRNMPIMIKGGPLCWKNVFVIRSRDKLPPFASVGCACAHGLHFDSFSLVSLPMRLNESLPKKKKKKYLRVSKTFDQDSELV